MPWKLSMMNATNDVSYPYGNYANRAISTDISQNNAIKSFAFGKVKIIQTLAGTFSYVVIDTAIPTWVYRDRLSTNNGSHELFYKDYEGNTYREIERTWEIHKLTSVVMVI